VLRPVRATACYSYFIKRVYCMFAGSYHELIVSDEASCSFVYVAVDFAVVARKMLISEAEPTILGRNSSWNCAYLRASQSVTTVSLSPWPIYRRHASAIRRISRQAFSRAAGSAIYTRRSRRFTGHCDVA